MVLGGLSIGTAVMLSWRLHHPLYVVVAAGMVATVWWGEAGGLLAGLAVFLSAHLPAGPWGWRTVEAVLYLLIGYCVGGSVRHWRTVSRTDPITRVFRNEMFVDELQRFVRYADRKNRYFCLVAVRWESMRALVAGQGPQRADDAFRQLAGIVRETLGKRSVIGRVADDTLCGIIHGMMDLGQRRASEIETKAQSLPPGQRLDVRTTVVLYPRGGTADANDLLQIMTRNLA
jgi:GGDEF domain-containing protein